MTGPSWRRQSVWGLSTHYSQTVLEDSPEDVGCAWLFALVIGSPMIALAPRAPRSSGTRFDIQVYVEHRRFELLTSSMRTKRATNCANAPMAPSLPLAQWPTARRVSG